MQVKAGGHIANLHLGNSADEIVAKLVAALDARGAVAKAAEGGLGRETIFKLARRLKPTEVIDFDQAVAELENAVQIALDVIARGERGTNLDDFVQRVLQQLVETTKRGDFDAGSRLVDESLKRLDEEHRASRTALLEAGVEQDLLRRDAAAVARRIETIVATDETDGDPVWTRDYKERFNAFYEEGEKKGINFSLEVAIEIARRMLAAARDADLGETLRILGERESGTARLEEAVAAFRAALEVYTRERVPLEWAKIQMNLGNVLDTLGARESGTARLAEAVAAYRAALKERTRERMPLQWAMTQMNLGIALKNLGLRESGTAKLRLSVEAFRAALEECTRDRAPLQWAGTQLNLGNTLCMLGARDSGKAWLEEAVPVYRAVLEECTRERAPIQWAKTQMSLGAALGMLGTRESGTKRLEEGIEALSESLKENTRERVPLEWAKASGNQGISLMVLAERRHDARMAKKALDQIEAALKTARDGGDLPSAASCEAQLPRARNLVQRLSKQ